MEYTKFTKVEAKEFKGKLGGKATVSTAVDYALTEEEKQSVIGITATAASKTVTLGLDDGQVAFVINEGGTNAFTVKNVSGDSGTSVAAGKVALIVASSTATKTAVYVLN